jgi:hypothetical protein
MTEPIHILITAPQARAGAPPSPVKRDITKGTVIASPYATDIRLRTYITTRIFIVADILSFCKMIQNKHSPIAA